MTAKRYWFSAFCLCALPLRCVSPALAVPTLGTEPALHDSAPPPVAEVPRWRTFTSTAGRFSILLPGTPTTQVRVLSAVKETLQQFICRSDGSVYVVQYAERSVQEVRLIDAEKLLSFADAAFLHANHSSLVSKRTLVLDGYPGHEIVARLSTGRTEFQRTYLVGRRRYTLITAQPYGQPKTGSPDVTRFFDSFTLHSSVFPHLER